MDWAQVLAIIVTNAAIVVPLFFWNRSEANADRRDMINLIKSIETEMKDFHGRLERQDAEFRAYLIRSNEK